jgi:hypothetical protein
MSNANIQPWQSHNHLAPATKSLVPTGTREARSRAGFAVSGPCAVPLAQAA